MKCTTTSDLIDDYVDGTLEGAALHEVELHLAGCAACREEERGLRALLAEADALPEDIDPPRDLWPGIAARLEREEPQLGVDAWGKRFKLLRGPWRLPLGLAAAVVLASGAYFVWHTTPRPTAPAVAGTPVPEVVQRPVSLPSGTLPPDLVEAEREYAQATAALMVVLEQRRGEMAPDTVASVEENLRRIDVALAELRAALRQSPDNTQLTRLLTSTHRKKVQTLQQVVKLSQSS
jgi:anti-sigma factor RsiW